MRFRSLFTAASILVLLISGPAHALRSPIPSLRGKPAILSFGRQKTVTINVRNDSREIVELRNGDSVIKLEPGKTVAMVLPVGSRVLFEKATATHAPGDLLLNAAKSLSDSTVVIH